MSLAYTSSLTPVGKLKLVASIDRLVAVLWENDDPGRVRVDPLVKVRDHPVLMETRRQIDAYFAKRLDRFDLPLEFRGSDFQRIVWAALLTIPYGETRSYGQIALQIGRPTASRAVGAANGRNPISIIAPCHRVVGSGGALVGFAGGIGAKRYLLSLEGQGTTVGSTRSAPPLAVPFPPSENGWARDGATGNRLERGRSLSSNKPAGNRDLQDAAAGS